jgi:uncharacterized damage-inducible protein DinB
MITADYYRLMAEYNAWMNGKVYGQCASMPEADVYEDRGAYFKSIVGCSDRWKARAET